MRDGMDRQEYLNKILEQIDNKTLREEIEKEMSAHIDDREQYYRDCGYDSETAASKAVERMGSPEAAADGFSKVHKNYRRVTVTLTVLSLLSSVFAFLLFWSIMIFVCIDDSTMGAGITEAMFLMYIIGLSAIGKRRNSRFICFVAIVDFVMMFVRYFFEVNYLHNNIYEVCSRIVLKLVCLLTGDFECLSAFWQVGGITVAPYLTYLSIAFYTVVFILLILVFISVWRLKKPTYGLRTKRFTGRVFKAQKAMWFFIAATMLILPISGSFDEQAEMTVKPKAHFNAVIIAQSDTPCPISEIPTEDILTIVSNYDWSNYILDWYIRYSSDTNSDANIITCSDTENFEIVDSFYGDSLEKKCGNKLKYIVSKFYIPCYLTKEYVYIEFVNEYPFGNLNDETAYKFVSDKPENWYEAKSTDKISAAVDAYNQVEIIVKKSPLTLKLKFDILFSIC